MIFIRSLFISFLFLVFSQCATSQILVSLIFGDALNSPKTQFGLELGFNAATVTNNEVADWTGGLDLGLFFNWKYKERWALYTTVQANSNRGLQRGVYEMIEESYLPGNDYEFRYMKVRLVYGGAGTALRYYFLPGLSAALGFNAGLRFKATDESVFTKGDATLAVEYSVSQEYTLIDIGPTAALLYQLRQGKGLSIVGRFYYGLVDVDKLLPGTQNNMVGTIGVDILIGAKKAEDLDKHFHGEGQ